MGLYKRGKTWWISYTDPSGLLVRRSTKETNKRKAEDQWVATRTGVINGSYTPEAAGLLTAPPFEIAVESYLADRVRRGKRIDSYRKMKLWVEVFAGRPLQGITLAEVEEHLARWTDDRGWAPATYNNALSQVSGVLTYAYRKGWIDRHPIRGRAERMVANNERQRYLRPGEVEVIKAAALELAAAEMPEAPDWLHDIIVAAVSTGIRRGALCSLRCADIERDEGGTLWLFIGKDKNGEALHKRILGELAEIVDRRLRGALPGAFLFPGPEGGNAYTSIGRYLPEAVRMAGERNPDLGLRWGAKGDGITFHTMRHTFASLAANNGVPLDVLQRMGNWRTPSMMRRYAHLADERLQAGEERLAEVLHCGADRSDAAGG